MTIPVQVGVELAIRLVELAAEVAPGIISAIKSSGEYTDEQRAALIARVDRARVKVATYQPRDV